MVRFVPLLLGVLLLFSSCATTKADKRAQLALDALLEERWERSAAHYEQALSLSDDNPQWHYNYLWVLLQNGEYEEVIQLSERAFERFDTHLQFLQIKAKALLSIGNQSEAFALYNDIFEKNPGLQDVEVLVMQEAYSHGDNTMAELLAKKLISYPQWEREALTILDQIHPNMWYESALLFLNHQL